VVDAKEGKFRAQDVVDVVERRGANDYEAD